MGGLNVGMPSMFNLLAPKEKEEKQPEPYKPRVVVGDCPFSVRHAEEGPYSRLSKGGAASEEELAVEAQRDSTTVGGVQRSSGTEEVAMDEIDGPIQRTKGRQATVLQDFSNSEVSPRSGALGTPSSLPRR